jgi:putative CocE/NonD family hydrolase
MCASRSVTRQRLFAAVLVFLTASAAPGQQPAAEAARRFVKTDQMIPMRDGVRLNTAIYAPRDAKGTLPFLLLRTPYGIDRAANQFRSYLKDLADDGYIFAFQDIRGRFKSEGRFVMGRPPRDRADAKAIDESTDTYDTIAWLLKNVPNHNGRVGMLGISYGGWLTVMAMLDPHPALKAVSPQASPADQFLGDDFHHNGAFRLSYGFEYVAMMETSKVNDLFKFDRHDTFEWYLRLGALGNVNARYFHGKMPSWNDFVAHPNYDDFWKKLAFAPYLDRVTVPTLNVAGWWDQEDFYGPLKIYELLERHDDKNQNFLVVGPWNHGGWAAGDGASLGKIPFESATGTHFRHDIQAPWFAYYLKDRGTPKQPEALTFETGSNRWVSHAQWPPTRDITARRLYFHADGRLSFDPPARVAPDADSYISDPAHPVPYRPRPIEPTYQGSGWGVWELEDQRFIHLRPDVLSYETEPLADDMAVAGDLVAHLCASTTGTDADWIVKLIDVYPDDAPDRKLAGFQLMVAGEVFRARFRNSFDKPEAVEADRVIEYPIDLHWRDHCFRKGHKIMVQVQSTWFPLIDRNPQTFVPNIYEAKDADYRPATQRVYRTPEQASYIALPALRPAAKETKATGSAAAG